MEFREYREDLDIRELLEELRARQASQEAEVKRLNARLAVQDDELRRLRASSDTSLEVMRHANGDQRSTRRALIGAAAAAMGTLAMLGGSRTAHADDPPYNGPTTGPSSPETGGGSGTKATGGNMIIGQSNLPTAIDDVTRLVENGAIRHYTLFQSDNSISVNVDQFNAAGNQIAILGSADNVALAGTQQVGVYGFTPNGYGMIAQGLWPLTIVPRATSGTPARPPSNDGTANSVREGTLYYGINSGTGSGEDLWLEMGNSGWQRIITEFGTGAGAPIGPVRVLDTRPTGGGATLTGFDGVTDLPIAAGARAPGVYSFRVANRFGIPSDVRGIFGTVSLQDLGPSGGFATVFQGGSPPNAATIVPQPTSPFIASTSFYTLTSGGNFSINTVSSPRHLIADVSIFYY